MMYTPKSDRHGGGAERDRLCTIQVGRLAFVLGLGDIDQRPESQGLALHELGLAHRLPYPHLPFPYMRTRTQNHGKKKAFRLEGVHGRI